MFALVSTKELLQDVTKSSTSTIVPKDIYAENTETAFSHGQISIDEKVDQLLLKWEADMGTKYTIVVRFLFF